MVARSLVLGESTVRESLGQRINGPRSYWPGQCFALSLPQHRAQLKEEKYVPLAVARTRRMAIQWDTVPPVPAPQFLGTRPLLDYPLEKCVPLYVYLWKYVHMCVWVCMCVYVWDHWH